MSNRIYLCLAHMSEAGWEQKYIQEAFDTNWVVPLGPNVNGFEEDLKQYVCRLPDGTPVTSKEIVALSSGTAAVHLGLLACDVGSGDEVLVQSFTFCASTHPIKYLGATPIMIDSEADTWNMDPQLLEEAIKDRIALTGRKPKAIVPVYLYGMPAKIDEILAIAARYDIPVVEDAAEGFGSRYKGRVVGTFGDYGVLSFNGNKMITTSGGGALVCPDTESRNRVMWYATQAREAYPYYHHEAVGYNYRMSNICAGIGRGQMTIVDEHIAHHRHIAAMYRDAFAHVDGITFHDELREMQSNFWLSITAVVRCIPIVSRIVMSRPCAWYSTRLALSHVRSGSPCTVSPFIAMHQPTLTASARISSTEASVCLLAPWFPMPMSTASSIPLMPPSSKS